MFCKNCGKKLENNETFCSGCGTKVMDSESNNSQTNIQKELNQSDNKKGLSTIQIVNFIIMIIGLISLFIPFVSITFKGDLQKYGNITNTVSQIDELIGQAIFVLIFVAMYLNYVKKMKPLIFIFIFFLVTNTLMYISSNNSFDSYAAGIGQLLGAGSVDKLKDMVSIDISKHPLIMSGFYFLSTILTIRQSRKK